MNKEKNSDKVKRFGLEYRFYRRKMGEIVNGKSTQGVMTICIAAQPDPNHEGMTLYHRGVTWCDPNDQYIRKEGYTKALGHVISAVQRGYSHTFTGKRFTKVTGMPSVCLYQNNVLPTMFELQLLGITKALMVT